MYGNVQFNKLNRSAGVFIGGTQISPLIKPVTELPEVAAFTVGVNTLSIPRNSTATIPAGDFLRIEIGRESVVRFSGGIYNATALRIDSAATVSFSAPTVINVTQDLVIEDNSSLTGTTVGASDVVINYSGTNTVAVGANAILYARIIAPNAAVVLGRGGEYRGFVAASEVSVGQTGKLSSDDASASSHVDPFRRR